MKRTTQYTTLGLLAAFGTTAIVPMAAMAGNDSARQSNKNLMRNLAIGGAAIAGYGLLNHNNNLTLLGAAGAALAGSQYEKARHNQSVDQSRDDARYYRSDGGDYESYAGRDNRDNNDGYRFSSPSRGQSYGSWQHRHYSDGGR